MRRWGSVWVWLVLCGHWSCCVCVQVNIIPVIAKADTLTPEECAQFKKRVSAPPHQIL